MKLCDRCSKTNTEFSEFDITIDLESVKDRSKFSGSSWIRKVVIRYISRLLDKPLRRTVTICQTCSSQMFRKLDKDK